MGFTVVTERIKHEFSKRLLKENCKFDFLNFKHFSPSTFKSMHASVRKKSVMPFRVVSGMNGFTRLT